MKIDGDRLFEHLCFIAEEPHPAESVALERVRGYVQSQLEAAGWEVVQVPFVAKFEGEDAVTFSDQGDEDWEEGEVLRGVNLVARHPGEPRPGKPRFCIGAHYDTKPTTPGADDNSTAVATLLELARLIPECWDQDQETAIELVAFDLEECGMLGGAHHASTYQDRKEELVGMVSLEMLGYCSHEAGSQKLPDEIAHLYSSTGDFIAVVGNQDSQSLMDVFKKGFQSVSGLPCELLQVPNNGVDLPATRLSDHSPFWDAGFPALMVTDTSFLRNPNYHLASDLPETIDGEFHAKVSQGCFNAICGLISNKITR